MDVKFGKVRPNSNLFLASSVNHTEDNFFAANSDSGKNNQDKKQENCAPGSRLNDYDSHILENNAYQGMSDEMFKCEHRIAVLEETLSKVNSEIEALESLNAEIQVCSLKERKAKIEQELMELNKKYSDLGLSSKISGQIASAMSFTSTKKSNSFSKLKKLFSKKVLSKVSKKFDYNQNMKEALENLSNINLSVDELIKMQVPYGETIDRYDKLTAYLNKANVIHSQISRNMNEITKKKHNI